MAHTHTHTHTHILKPVYEQEDVTMSRNQGIHTERKATANRPDIIIKNKKRGNMHADRRGNTCGQECHAKGSRKNQTTRFYVE